MPRENKAAMKERLEGDIARLEQELTVARADTSADAQAVAGDSGTPSGSSAAAVTVGVACYVRYKHTASWQRERVGVGVVVINPPLNLLQSTHGRWEWCPGATWDATARKYHYKDGHLRPWRASAP